LMTEINGREVHLNYPALSDGWESCGSTTHTDPTGLHE